MLRSVEGERKKKEEKRNAFLILVPLSRVSLSASSLLTLLSFFSLSLSRISLPGNRDRSRAIREVPIIDSRSLIGQVALREAVALHRTAPQCTAHARTCGFLNLVIRLYLRHILRIRSTRASRYYSSRKLNGWKRPGSPGGCRESKVFRNEPWFEKMSM